MRRKALRLLMMFPALAGIAAGSAMASNPAAPAATITVDSLADEQEFDGNCTLREALLAAALNLPWDGCAAGSGEDLIVFALDGTIEMALGEFVVNSPVTIQGNGRAETVIDAGGDGAIFFVSETSLALEALTLQNGYNDYGGAIEVDGEPGSAGLELDDVVIQDSIAQFGGGAIYVHDNPLTVANSLLQDNVAGEGGGIYAHYGQVYLEDSVLRENQAVYQGGGALECQSCYFSITESVLEDNYALDGSGGALSCGNCDAGGLITDSIITDNIANTAGGAVSLYASGEILIIRSLIAGNLSHSTTYGGGGVFCICFLTIIDSTIRDNVAVPGDGGGIYLEDAHVAILGSTISGNMAGQGSGGGINSDVFGSHLAGDFLLSNSTVSGNSALVGGGLSLEIASGTTATVRFATIAGNTATAALVAGGAIFIEPAGLPLTLSRSIISGNSDNPTCYPAGDIVSRGFNVLQDDSCGDDVTDLVGVDPLLGPLADNGGETETHALLPTSPAIDAADCLEEITVDQRGVARPQGDDCDSGSYEFAGNGGYKTYLPIILEE